jgi:hypothetical protein
MPNTAHIGVRRKSFVSVAVILAKVFTGHSS